MKCIPSEEFVLMLLLSAVFSQSAEPRYAVTDLGTLGGSSSDGKAINNRGQIVGVSSTNLTGRVVSRAFLYSEGRMIDLGALGGTNSVANAINSSGQVAGAAQTTNQLYHAFLSDGHTMTDLGALLQPDPESFFNSYAYGINDVGEVVGSFSEFTSPFKAFLFSQGVMKHLGTLGGVVSDAADINNAGQVVGRSVTAEGDPRAFIYFNGEMQPLGPPDSRLIYPRDINDRSQVTGYGYEHNENFYRAYLYSEDAVAELTALPWTTAAEAMSMNNLGHAVGHTGTNSNSRLFDTACLWMNGETFDLNQLIDADSGWTLYEAVDINDNGQILANGYGPPGNRALLLTPRPRLQTLLLTAAGIDLEIHGMTGVTYKVEFTLSLPATAWTLLTNFVITSSPAKITDAAAQPPNTRFYRVVQSQF